MTEKIANSGMEYIGHLKFEPCNVVPETTFEEWMHNAQIEFLLSREAAVILNFDDVGLSEHLKRFGSTEEERQNRLCDMVDSFQSWSGRYEAGKDVTDAVVRRLLVIGERWIGKEAMDAVGDPPDRPKPN